MNRTLFAWRTGVRDTVMKRCGGKELAEHVTARTGLQREEDAHE